MCRHRNLYSVQFGVLLQHQRRSLFFLVMHALWGFRGINNSKKWAYPVYSVLPQVIRSSTFLSFGNPLRRAEYLSSVLVKQMILLNG